ncbi:MAG: toll/interleukin-1 receptor domain-containing protein, partial [Ginsengibacter sp.]
MILEKIFFSYSRADGSAFALRLALDLKKEGFNVWIDQEDIRAGSEWDLEIEKALETCDCLLFIETEKSVSSNNVLDEVYYALEQKKKVIPLIVVDSKTPFRLQRLQHIDFAKNYHTGLGLLINELRDTTAAESFAAGETATIVAPAPTEPFYKKYAVAILISALLIIAVVSFLVFNSKSNSTTVIRNENSPTDTIKNTNGYAEPVIRETANGNVEQPKTIVEKSRPINKKQSQDNVATVTPTAGNVIEMYSGDWKITSMQPNRQPLQGYMKIEETGGQKVSIKSSLQFYYPKTNDTSFLSIFNAFLSCSSCTLSNELKLNAEDVSIASQFYQIL